jgi:hypothetical protein
MRHLWEEDGPRLAQSRARCIAGEAMLPLPVLISSRPVRSEAVNRTGVVMPTMRLPFEWLANLGFDERMPIRFSNIVPTLETISLVPKSGRPTPVGREALEG